MPFSVNAADHRRVALPTIAQIRNNKAGVGGGGGGDVRMIVAYSFISRQSVHPPPPVPSCLGSPSRRRVRTASRDPLRRSRGRGAKRRQVCCCQ